MTRGRIGAYVLMLGPVLAFAQAGPPMLTDDPGTPGDGHWEINVAWTSERSADLRTSELPLADINYGVGERVQLKFEIPWLAVDSAGHGGNGFGNALAGVKWRFYDEGEDGWQVSTYPQVGFLMPGLHRSVLDDRGPTYLLPLEIQRSFGGLEAGVEIGRAFRAGAGPDGWIAGIAIGRELSERFELIGELHEETVDHAGHELAVNLGARTKLSDRFVLLTSIGCDIDNGIDPRNRLISYLGLQIVL